MKILNSSFRKGVILAAATAVALTFATPHASADHDMTDLLCGGENHRMEYIHKFVEREGGQILYTVTKQSAVDWLVASAFPYRKLPKKTVQIDFYAMPKNVHLTHSVFYDENACEITYKPIPSQQVLTLLQSAGIEPMTMEIPPLPKKQSYELKRDQPAI